jgi:excisionase family DNA binding protein
MALLTTKQTAQYLAVSVWTVRELIEQKKIPAFKVGKNYRIDEADIQEFINQNRI